MLPPDQRTAARTEIITLDRSLKALTLALAKGRLRRAQSLLGELSGEILQQMQVPLAGNAAKAAAFSDHDVTWRLPFLFAAQQRQAPFAVPQFGYGIEYIDAPTDIIIIQAAVVGWKKDARNWCIGANVRFIVIAPSISDTATVPYNAVAHLTFQGYAAQPGDTGV